MFLLERCLIVFLCNLPMGATGFGDAIVLYVILSFVGSTARAADTSELNEVIFLLTVGGIGSLGIQTWMLWDKINWELSLWLVVPTVACCMIGMTMLELLEDYALGLKHFLGLIFLSAALYKVRAEVNLIVDNAKESSNGHPSHEVVTLKGPLETNETTFWTVMAAATSGGPAGVYGTPGPPLMVWISSYNVPKDEWRAVNAIVWTIVNLFRLFHIVVLQSEYEYSDIAEVGSVLFLVGAVGAMVGAEASKWIGEYAFRIFIIVLLIFGANTMLFAGKPMSEPIVGIVTTFLGVLFYSFYMIVINRMPEYPSSHTSSTALFVHSVAEFFGVGGAVKKRRSNDFGAVKYTAVRTVDEAGEIGRV